MDEMLDLKRMYDQFVHQEKEIKENKGKQVMLKSLNRQWIRKYQYICKGESKYNCMLSFHRKTIKHIFSSL